MSASFKPFWRIRQLLGLDPLPSPKPAAPTAPRIPQPSQGTMKKAEAPPPKTYGTGLESMAIYGALPPTQQRVAEAQIEAKNEAATHEREINTPILTYQGRGSEFGSQSGGLGITNPSIVRDVQRWETEQRALLNTVKAPPVTSMSPIKTFKN